MIDGLKGIEFKFDVGEDETGHQMKYRRKGGGYNLDAGSSELMIKGEIGLLQNDQIETLLRRCVAERRHDRASRCRGYRDGLLSPG